MAKDIQTPINAPELKTGPYLAKIVSHLDPTYMGTLEVQLLREVGNDPDTEGQLHQVKYMSPFYGVTNLDFNGAAPDDYNNTQKSYGMWMIPPDVGTTVVVMFIEGDPRKGYWIGCAMDDRMNFMVPGYAASKYVTNSTTNERLPVAEYNKRTQSTVADPTNYKKPVHPFKNVLARQGLLKDDIRGITTSSARREVPSAVFGISTPGPIDKQSNAKKGSFGKAEYKITNAFVSRLGGSSFVMDDGDDKFLRKKPAKDGPPEYVQVEQGETGGDPTIPHNELVRIRTRTGHQILLHNSEDLIYIANANGTTWIELTSNGKIDIYAKDSISIHTEQDLNVTADRGINLSAADDINICSKKNVNITSGMNTNIKSDGNHYETANTINMNGSQAAAEAKIPTRIPQHEPWNGHENLDPTMFVPDKTIPKDRNMSTSSQANTQAIAAALAQATAEEQALQDSLTLVKKAGKLSSVQQISQQLSTVKAQKQALQQQLTGQGSPAAFEQYTTTAETFSRITKG